jgi:hypothetical protein
MSKTNTLAYFSLQSVAKKNLLMELSPAFFSVKRSPSVTKMQSSAVSFKTFLFFINALAYFLLYYSGFQPDSQILDYTENVKNHLCPVVSIEVKI